MKLPENPESKRAGTEIKWRRVSRCTVNSGRVEIAALLGLGDERGTSEVLRVSTVEAQTRGETLSMLSVRETVGIY